MTRLYGEKLLEYLGHLKSETKERITKTSRNSLEHLSYQQMYLILEKELEFLKYMNSNVKTNPVLSISLNGLPSVVSLKKDLIKMKEIAKQEDKFKDIAQRFQSTKSKEVQKKRGGFYKNVDVKEFNKILRSKEKSKLDSRIYFQISQDHESKLKVLVSEETYLKGYDKLSREFPFVIREAEATYTVVWDQLIDNMETRFLVPKVISSSEKEFKKKKNIKLEDINYTCELFKRHHDKEKAYLKKRKSWKPENYSDILDAGYDFRLDFANKTLEILEPIFGKIDINLKGEKGNLEDFLKFEHILFENAPELTPHENDLKREETTLFLDSSMSQEIGIIEYVPPSFIAKHNSDGGFSKSIFSFGKIKWKINGSTIENYSQFKKLKKDLLDCIVLKGGYSPFQIWESSKE